MLGYMDQCPTCGQPLPCPGMQCQSCKLQRACSEMSQIQKFADAVAVQGETVPRGCFAELLVAFAQEKENVKEKEKEIEKLKKRVAELEKEKEKKKKDED